MHDMRGMQEWIKLLHSVSHVADVLELLVDAPEAPQATAHSMHASVDDLLPRQDVWPPPAAGVGPPDPLTPNSMGGLTGTVRNSSPHAAPTELTGLQWVLTALDSACMHLRHLRVLDFNRLVRTCKQEFMHACMHCRNTSIPRWTLNMLSQLSCASALCTSTVFALTWKCCYRAACLCAPTPPPARQSYHMHV